MHKQVEPVKKSGNPVSSIQGENALAETNNRQNIKPNIIKYWQIIKNTIEILTFFVLAITMWMTNKTLQEMQKNRIESYKAVITANPVTETLYTTACAHDIYTDISDWPGNTNIYTTGYASYSFLTETGSERYTEIPCSDFNKKNNFTQIAFANSGPGMATKVFFSWDDGNVDTLYRLLLDVDEKASHYTNFEGSTFSYYPEEYYSDIIKNTSLIESDLVDVCLNIPTSKSEFSYMLSNSSDTYMVDFPIIYSLLFSEILIHDPSAEPSVQLKVEFSDTQGIKYIEYITLRASDPSTLAYLRDPNGIGFGITYKITTDYNNPERK